MQTHNRLIALGMAAFPFALAASCSKSESTEPAEVGQSAEASHPGHAVSAEESEDEGVDWAGIEDVFARAEKCSEEVLTRFEAQTLEGVLTPASIAGVDLHELADQGISVNAAKQLNGLQSMQGGLQESFSECFAEADRIEARWASEAEQERVGTVMLFISIPSEFEDGYQGVDTISQQQVYVETAQHAPAHMGQTARLMPIQGNFKRDGSISGTNGFGATITIPRYVDAPSDAENHFRTIQQRRQQVEGPIRTRLEQIVANAVRAIQNQRVVVLDGMVPLCESEDHAAVFAAINRVGIRDQEVDHRLNAVARQQLVGRWQGDVSVKIRTGRYGYPPGQEFPENGPTDDIGQRYEHVTVRGTLTIDTTTADAGWVDLSIHETERFTVEDWDDAKDARRAETFNNNLNTVEARFDQERDTWRSRGFVMFLGESDIRAELLSDGTLKVISRRESSSWGSLQGELKSSR